MSDILSANDAALKFEQLKMLSDSVRRARKAFLKNPGPKSALVLQSMQQDYKEARAYMPLRIVQ